MPKEDKVGSAAMKTMMSLDPNDPRADEIMSKICVPHASEGTGGKQKGVKLPWQVEYPKSKGKQQIDGIDAINRYRKKIASGAPAFPVEMDNVKIGGPQPGEVDPFSVPDNKTEEEITGFIKDIPVAKPRRKTVKKVDSNADLVTGLVEKLSELLGNKQTEADNTPMENPYKYEDVLGDYKRRMEMVRLKLPNGQIQMPCIAVVPDQYSVTVIMRCDNQGFTFIPDPGTDLYISWKGGRDMKAYFPGSQFVIQELGIMGLVFMVDVNNTEVASQQAPVKKVMPDKNVAGLFKFNPESGMEEDEFGLGKV